MVILKRERFDAGFTLMEVIIAIAVLGLGLVVLLHTHAVNIDACNRSRALFISTMLAQSKMGEAEIMGFDLLSPGSGDFGDEYPAFLWERSVQEAPFYDDARVVEVVVYARDDAAARARLVSLMRRY